MRDPVTLAPVIETVSFSGDGGDLLQVLDDLDPLLLDSGGREAGGHTIRFGKRIFCLLG